jgi:hypothetical protein
MGTVHGLRRVYFPWVAWVLRGRRVQMGQRRVWMRVRRGFGMGVERRRMGRTRSRAVTVEVARRRMGRRRRSRAVTVEVARRRMGRRRSRAVTAEGRRNRGLVGGCYRDIQTF